MPDRSRIHGEGGIRLKDRALSGVVGGEINSVSRVGEVLERVLDRPPGSLIPTGVEGNARWSANLGGTIARPAALSIFK